MLKRSKKKDRYDAAVSWSPFKRIQKALRGSRRKPHRKAQKVEGSKKIVLDYLNILQALCTIPWFEFMIFATRGTIILRRSHAGKWREG